MRRIFTTGVGFEKGKIYHIYNRGVEKRIIFKEDKDYFRFIHNLFEFNDESPAGKFSSGKVRKDLFGKTRNKLTEILCFVLMPNHYHLILREIKEGGTVKFLKKLGGGYARYFNEKYERVGPLFQGRFKAIDVDNENYFIYLSYYVHFNPIEIIEPDWKEKGIEDVEKVLSFLKSYRFSSLLDYIGIKNFPSVIDEKFLLEFFDNSTEKYKEFLLEFLKDYQTKLEEIKGYTLESI